MRIAFEARASPSRGTLSLGVSHSIGCCPDRTLTRAESSKEGAARPANFEGPPEGLPASTAPPRLESTSKRKRRSTVKAQEAQEQARSGPGRRKK